jgi:hypothetical protein
VSVPTFREADLRALVVPDPGWHYDDAELAGKLQASLRRHGQLRAIVVRQGSDGAPVVVDGRHLLRAMLASGMERGWVADVGVVEVHAAQQLALDLELKFEVDYAKLAVEVAGLLEQGATAESLAGASPWTAERIGYLGRLAFFDWDQFREVPEGQAALAWDDEPVAENASPAALEPPAAASPAVEVPEVRPNPVAVQGPPEADLPLPAPEPPRWQPANQPDLPPPAAPAPADGQMGLF